MRTDRMDEDSVAYLLSRVQCRLRWIGDGCFALRGGERIFICTREELETTERNEMVDLVLTRLLKEEK